MTKQGRPKTSGFNCSNTLLPTTSSPLLKEVLDFCLNTDVNAKLGLSLSDLLELPRNIYDLIRKSVMESKHPQEFSEMDKLLKELDKR